jgi:DNA repair photolyase
MLRSARAAGAQHAVYTLVRLPLTVAPVFLEWLQREQPGRAQKIETRIRGMRGGKLNSSQFGDRMRGSGAMADQITSLFRSAARKLGLDQGLPPCDLTRFSPPLPRSGQLRLF